MPKFISLRKLRDSVWPLCVTRNLVTDMTGVSLPILDFLNKDVAHPYRAMFLLYYAVPDKKDPSAPDRVTLPYTLVLMDMQTGELLDAKAIRSGQESHPLVGPGVRDDVHQLADQDRRNMQDLFFGRYDQAAQIYPSKKITPENAILLGDLLDLFEILSEPPLSSDYDTHGKEFLTWLRTNSNRSTEK